MILQPPMYYWLLVLALIALAEPFEIMARARVGGIPSSLQYANDNRVATSSMYDTTRYDASAKRPYWWPKPARAPGPPPRIVYGPSYPTSSGVAYEPNCEYPVVGLYSVARNIPDPIQCGNFLCAGNPKCTHFSWLGQVGPDGQVSDGQCLLLSYPYSGGDWYSTYRVPTVTVCGHIPERSVRPYTIKMCNNATSDHFTTPYFVTMEPRGTVTIDGGVGRSDSNSCQLLVSAKNPDSQLKMICTSTSKQFPSAAVKLVRERSINVRPSEEYIARNTLLLDITQSMIGAGTRVVCHWDAYAS